MQGGNREISVDNCSAPLTGQMGSITYHLVALHLFWPHYIAFWRHYMFFTQNARKMLSFQVFEKTVLHAALHEMQCRKTTVPAIRTQLVPTVFNTL